MSLNHSSCMEQPSFFAIIPATVRYSKDLEPNAKLLYGELTALASIQGYAYPSNEYLAELYNVSDRTIRTWLQSLSQHNFIKIEIEDGHKRKIYILQCFNTKEQQKEGGGKKTPGGGRKRNSGGAVKNLHHINTSINTDDSSYISKEIYSESSSSIDVKKNDDDDACGAKINKTSYGDVTVVHTNGQKETMSQNDIFRHFLKLPYETSVVQEAIERIKQVTGPVNSILHYLKKICDTIVKERSFNNSKTNSFKKTKNTFIMYDDHEENKPKTKKNIVRTYVNLEEYGITTAPIHEA